MRPTLPLGAALLAGACAVVGACGANPPAAGEARAAVPVVLPPSALAGAVHALERLSACWPGDVLVQVRALEASALELHSAPGLRVRVVLHLTVYAWDGARARAALDELRAALEADARRPLTSEGVAPERARAVVGSDWTPAGAEELLSYSDAVRLEYTPARAAPAGTALRGSAPALAPSVGTSVGIRAFVRTAAAAAGLPDLELFLRPSAPAPGVAEMRAFLHEAGASTGHTRAELGAFLAALESGSPVARVTEIQIEPSPNAVDPRGADAWALEAVLVVRVPADE